jgi:dTDP-4-dehydrorhamnose reductase
MKVLITGANGLLGQKLYSNLATRREFIPLATGKGACRLEKGTRYHELDITDPDAIFQLFEDWRPDAIVHAAALTQVDYCEKHPSECTAINITGTKNLLEAAKSAGSRFIFISSDFVFSGRQGPYQEDDEPDPVNVYGQSKLEGERLVKQSGLPWSIVRTVLVYGVARDMSRSNIVLWARKNLEEGKAIRVVNDQWRTPTLVEDLADGCRLILDQVKTGIFHISGQEMLTPYDMAVRTARHFGLNKDLISPTNATEFAEPAKRPPKTGFIIDKAKTMLGFNPKGFDEGLGVVAMQLAGTG